VAGTTTATLTCGQKSSRKGDSATIAETGVRIREAKFTTVWTADIGREQNVRFQSCVARKLPASLSSSYGLRNDLQGAGGTESACLIRLQS